jgi:hypothetical protein
VLRGHSPAHRRSGVSLAGNPCNACVAPCCAGIRPLTAVLGRPENHPRGLVWLRRWTANLPVQVMTPTPGLDRNYCSQQVAPLILRLVSLGPYNPVAANPALDRGSASQTTSGLYPRSLSDSWAPLRAGRSRRT